MSFTQSSVAPVAISMTILLGACSGAVERVPSAGTDLDPGEETGNDDAIGGFSPEQLESGYPCDLAAMPLPATPLRGPFDSAEALRTSEGIGEWILEGPSVEYGGEGPIFASAKIVSAPRGDSRVYLVIVTRGEKWFASTPLAGDGETLTHAGPIVTDEGEGRLDRMMVYLEVKPAAGVDAGFDGRNITLICSTGQSSIPACLVVPESWDLVLDGEHSTARLHTLQCEDGSMVFYGNPTILPAGEIEKARGLLGRRILVFP